MLLAGSSPKGALRQRANGQNQGSESCDQELAKAPALTLRSALRLFLAGGAEGYTDYPTLALGAQA